MPSEKSSCLVYGRSPTFDQLTAPNLGLNYLQKASASVKLKFFEQIVLQ